MQQLFALATIAKFKKSIVSVETIRGNTTFKKCEGILLLWTLEQLEKKLCQKGYTFVYLPTSLGSNQSWIPIHKLRKDNSIFVTKSLVYKLQAFWRIKIIGQYHLLNYVLFNFFIQAYFWTFSSDKVKKFGLNMNKMGLDLPDEKFFILNS